MKLTIDLRYVVMCLGFLSIGLGLNAATTQSPPTPSRENAAISVTPPVLGVVKWEFKCVGHEAANVEQNWANHDLDKANGWNPYLSKMTAQGWEPVVLIAPQGVIVAVCFRRPSK